MLKFVASCLVKGMLGSVVFLTPSFVSAEQIALTLKAHDHTFTGEFLDYEDDNYIIMTQSGEMRVPAVLVTCEGTDCRPVIKLAADN